MESEREIRGHGGEDHLWQARAIAKGDVQVRNDGKGVAAEMIHYIKYDCSKTYVLNINESWCLLSDM